MLGSVWVEGPTPKRLVCAIGPVREDPRAAGQADQGTSRSRTQVTPTRSVSIPYSGDQAASASGTRAEAPSTSPASGQQLRDACARLATRYAAASGSPAPGPS